jgi:hypothetical protein
VSANRQAGQRGAASRGGGAGRGGGGASRGGNGGASRGGAGRGPGARRTASARAADGPVTAGRQAAGRQAAGRAKGQGRRPLPKGQSLYTPGASAGRRAVERRSAALLVYLHQLPRWVPPVVLAALLLTGLTVHGIGGAIALVAVALVLVWLAVVSWPSLSPAGRVVRLLVTALVIGAAVVQVVR